MDPRAVAMAERLWQQAQHDLDAARALLGPRTHFAAAFHAHEAAEKSLKALHWRLAGKEGPRIHDLVRIGDELARRGRPLPEEVQTAVELLQAVYGESRYPSADESRPIPGQLIGEEQALASIRSAERVLLWVDTAIQPPTS